MPISDHPLRYQLANELHARPFPVMSCPGQIAYIALKPVTDAASRDRALDRAISWRSWIVTARRIPRPTPRISRARSANTS